MKDSSDPSLYLQDNSGFLISAKTVLLERANSFYRYIKRNPSLAIGLFLLLGLVLFWSVGAMVWDTSKSAPLSATPNQPPSSKYPLGTDKQGRDLLAAMIVGTPLTLKIGLFAGIIGVGIGTILAFIAGYYGGIVDTVIKGVVDIGLTIPSLLVLIIIAVSLKESLTVNQMAFVVASTSWLWPTRTMRSQVITMKERAWVKVARLSGIGGLEIIFREMIPNLLPYIAASLINTVSAAILASIGLEALGLGPMTSPTLGMTIYWVIFHSALLHGMWWWWAPPIIIIVILFISLFLIAIGIDEIANPRLRRRA